MKKVFNCEYPDENIDEIKKWIKSKLIKEDGTLSKIGYNATIIVEIIEE
ncbi:MAG: hypothetical protein WC438_06345 [Candidatus Pacearchaeota archaeon]